MQLQAQEWDNAESNRVLIGMNQPVNFATSQFENLPETPPNPSVSMITQVKRGTISADTLLSLLQNYQLMPKLMRELLLDEAIAAIECTSEERLEACNIFYVKNGITADENRHTWLEKHQLSSTQLEHLLTRNLRIEKFKQAKWAHQLESYFLQRKAHLDRVIYSLIRVTDQAFAQELYFRIQNGEQSFAEVARSQSQGVESQTGGLVGPVELSVPHPLLAQKLASCKPGQLMPPSRFAEWVLIVRLEQYLPAELNDAMRQRLLNELFERWMQEQLSTAV